MVLPAVLLSWLAAGGSFLAQESAASTRLAFSTSLADRTLGVGEEKKGRINAGNLDLKSGMGGLDVAWGTTSLGGLFPPLSSPSLRLSTYKND